jgi:hypothetical protein
MDERFSFTPTTKENEASIKAISRSMTKESAQPFLQLIFCLTIFGVPLAIAAIFFRDSLNDICISFALFSALVVIISRLRKRLSPAIIDRVAIPHEIRFDASGISQTTDRAESRWPWGSLNRLHVLEDVIVLEFRDLSWAPLPNRLWPDEEEKKRFVENLRATAPNLELDLPPTSVPTPFTLINVGAGFASAELFLLQVFGATLAASSWDAPIQFTRQHVPQAIGILFAAALVVAVVGFFGVRRVLRVVQRSYPWLAAGVSLIFIAMFVALVVAGALHHPCGC